MKNQLTICTRSLYELLAEGQTLPDLCKNLKEVPEHMKVSVISLSVLRHMTKLCGSPLLSSLSLPAY